MIARLFEAIIVNVQIQNRVQELLQIQLFHLVAMLAQLYNLFLGIKKKSNNKHPIYGRVYIWK